jgi:ribose 5-phosphate isomerase B
MKIALGSDHAGFELKEKLRGYLQQKGIIVDDRGTKSPESVDYPDYARLVGEDVIKNRADFGILVCGSGIGMSIAANKIAGIRAVNAHDETEAHLAREHNNANILTLGGRFLDESTAQKIIDKWLSTPFAGGRHGTRVEKISEIERGNVSQ